MTMTALAASAPEPIVRAVGAARLRPVCGGPIPARDGGGKCGLRVPVGRLSSCSRRCCVRKALAAREARERKAGNGRRSRGSSSKPKIAPAERKRRSGKRTRSERKAFATAPSDQPLVPITPVALDRVTNLIRRTLNRT